MNGHGRALAHAERQLEKRSHQFDGLSQHYAGEPRKVSGRQG
jgi:hypothetical protein